MSAAVDITNPEEPKRVAIIASNPSVSKQTGWPIGFWWAELTHPYCEFVEHGYKVDICSPDGGKLQADSWSDPRDQGRLMADDLISLGFIYSPQHSALIENSKPISRIEVGDYDAILFVADEFVGQRMQPFWIEEEAKKLPDTNFMVSGRFEAHAVRDGNLITGQQQYSAKAVARLVIEALGV
ncbi:MAG TPA: hypothetical protein VFA39_19220 [Steroidobacteraceae bacterium]|nr:hypothetical protein [Steroidobacteraceae bacterium]